MQRGLLGLHFFKRKRALREAQEPPEVLDPGRAPTDLTPGMPDSTGQAGICRHPERQRLVFKRRLFLIKERIQKCIVSCSKTKKAKLILKHLLKERVYS